MQIHYHEDGEILNLRRFLVLLNLALDVVIQFDSACLLNICQQSAEEKKHSGKKQREIFIQIWIYIKKLIFLLEKYNLPMIHSLSGF